MPYLKAGDDKDYSPPSPGFLDQGRLSERYLRTGALVAASDVPWG